MSESGSTIGTEGTKARNTKYRAWCFTWNNYPENFKQILDLNLSDCTEFHYQEEVGTNGTRHIQGCMKWASNRSFSAVQKKLPGVHLEACHNWNASVNYCRKNDTRAGISVSHGGGRRPVVDRLEGKTLYPWQQKIVDTIDTEPDDRTIHWIVDRAGNSGKTSFARSIALKYPNQVLYLGGRASDLKYGVKSFLENDKNDLKVVFLNYCRTVEGYVSYQGIEEVKDGIFFNTKYESGMVVFNYVHIFCFANFAPDMSALTPDRWKIIDLEEESI